MNLSVILLSGGKGLRMGLSQPKQYLPLGSKAVAEHSFDLFKAHPLIDKIVVVCEKEYEPIFREALFARPGRRRQDSVWNGLEKISSEWVLVHDAARPFLSRHALDRLIESREEAEALTLAAPLKFTLKEAGTNHFVTQTVDRNHHFEIQTPQMLKTHLLRKGLQCALTHALDLSDDVSAAELLHVPVKLILNPEPNFKITTSHDYTLAKALVQTLS